MLTTNSKHNLIISAVVVIAILGLGVFLLNRSPKENNIPVEIPDQNAEDNSDNVSIKSVEIKENNFTGSRPLISGSGELIVEANKYVDQTVKEFKNQADKDVPDIRKEFGADTPTANYTLELGATYLAGDKTESIVITSYAYTGGANGNSYFKVITASKKTGKVLALTDIVKKGEEAAFTTQVKKELIDFRPAGTNEIVVFEDVVNDLQFYNFSNWSLNDDNLTLYFAKYEVGPGVLGAVVLPIPLSEIDGMLETAF